MGDEFEVRTNPQSDHWWTARTAATAALVLALPLGLLAAAADVRVANARPALTADLATTTTAATVIPALLTLTPVPAATVIPALLTLTPVPAAHAVGEAGAAAGEAGTVGAVGAGAGTVGAGAGAVGAVGAGAEAGALRPGPADARAAATPRAATTPRAAATPRVGATARVGGAGGLDVAALRGAPGRLAGGGGRVGAEVGRIRWWVSARVGSDPGGVAAVRREAERVGRLGRAAGQLNAVLGPLEDGSADPDRLDDLARGISRYATASARVRGPGQEELERAAIASGLLTALSGADRPRRWSLCTPARCTSLTLTEGEVTRRRGGDPASSTSDVIVRVLKAQESEEMLFGPPEPGAPQRFDSRAVYQLLLTDPRDVRSKDPQEEAALTQLSR